MSSPARLERVLTAQVRPQSDAVAALAEIVERLSRTPAVIHASAINGGLPLAGGNWSTNIAISGKDIRGADA